MLSAGPEREKEDNFSRAHNVWGPRHRSKILIKAIFLTPNMHKIHFRPGFRPRPPWGAYDSFPHPLVGR